MLLGILVLVLGLISLIEVIFPSIAFTFWFYVSVIIFVCGLYKIIIEEKITIINAIITILGLLFSLVNLDILPPYLINAIIPILIIILGVTIIYNTSSLKKPYSRNNKSKRYNAILSDNIEKIKTLDKSDIESYTVFGNLKLDLSDLEIEDDINMIVYTIFGESTIIASDKYNIDLTSTAVLGENIKKFDIEDSKNKKTIYINCISIFGGAKITKNDKAKNK